MVVVGFVHFIVVMTAIGFKMEACGLVLHWENRNVKMNLYAPTVPPGNLYFAYTLGFFP